MFDNAWNGDALHRQTSLICSLPSTITMRREEVSRMVAIIRPLPELGSNKETAETVNWNTVETEA